MDGKGEICLIQSNNDGPLNVETQRIHKIPSTSNYDDPLNIDNSIMTTKDKGFLN